MPSKRRRRLPCLTLHERHEKNVEAFEHEYNHELSRVQEILRKLQLFIEGADEKHGKLTREQITFVFKDPTIHKAAQEAKKGKQDVDDEAKERLESLDKEHSNYLRRLLGKTFSKLNALEQRRIRETIVEKRDWCATVRSRRKYTEFMARSYPIMLEYYNELDRYKEQQRQQEEEEQRRQREKEERRKRRKTAPKTETRSQNIMAMVVSKKTAQQIAAAAAASTTSSSSDSSELTESRNQDIREFIPSTDDPSALWRLHRRYLREVEGEILAFDEKYDEIPDLDTLCCRDCQVNRVIDAKEGLATCPECCVCVPYQEFGQSSIPFNHPTEKKKIGNTYERVSHFTTWLQNVQGECIQEIPEELYTILWDECRRLDIRVVERRLTRRLLKRLGYVKFYDSVVLITSNLNDIPPPRFSEEEREFFRHSFMEAQPLFDACPPALKCFRKNFISYSYFLYQMCFMKGWDAYLPYFPLLRDENLLKHDRIWKWMCDNKQTEPLWTFYPTI